MKLDAAVIRSLLTPAMVLDYYAIAHRGNAQWSVQLCPACGQLPRLSLSIHPESGRWLCHHCRAHGGLLDLVAGYANLDIKTDFAKVLGVSALIAGVPHGVPQEEHAALLAAHQARRAEVAARDSARRARARSRMPMIWRYLAERSVKGERYLADRYLDPEALRARDAVRYSTSHDPAVALRDLSSGEIVGIQYRKLDGPTKLLCQPWSQATGACLLGDVTALAPNCLAILVEGLADTLAAQLTWPDALIFGAAGAGHLESVAAAIAPRVVAQRGRLLIVPDNDDVGIHNTAKAILAAQSAGLELVEQLRKDDVASMQIVDLGRNLADQRHHDLADARAQSRWRWSWPTP